MNIKLITSAMLCASFTLSAGKIELTHQELQAELQLEKKEAQSTKGVVTFATVANSGPDVNSCDFRIGGTVIQDAINDGNNYDEIRIVNGTYPENISLADRNITIKGGYASCADAINDNMTILQSSVETIINPVQPSSSPVIQITDGDTNTRETVTITNVRMTGGADVGFLTGGGLSTLVANLQLNLSHVWIDDNEGLLGGGLAVVAGNTDIYAQNLMVIGNTATDSGGGIFCTGSDASIFIDYLNTATDGFGIVGNIAEGGDGGGVLVTDGCRFTSYVGSESFSIFDPIDVKGIILNTATGNGGGVAVTNGGIANFYGNQFCFFGCSGSNTDPVSIYGNIADSDENFSGSGGGIFVTGVDSSAGVYNGWVAFNNAHRGGGVAVDDQGTFESGSIYTDFWTTSPVDCWSPGSCNRMEENTAESYGGGYEFLNGSSGEIVHTHITGNRADNVTALYVRDTNTVVDVSTSLIANNGDGGSGNYADNRAIRQFDESDLNITFTTIADNDVANSVIENVQANLFIGTSIIHQNNGLTATIYADNSANSSGFDCIMANEITSFGGGGELVADDPEFVDRNNGDFHLNENTSPAIDYCDQFITPVENNDIDNQARPWDWSNISNNIGPVDLGFDETSDLIFYNGFEQLSTPL